MIQLGMDNKTKEFVSSSMIDEKNEKRFPFTKEGALALQKYLDDRGEGCVCSSSYDFPEDEGCPQELVDIIFREGDYEEEEVERVSVYADSLIKVLNDIDTSTLESCQKGIQDLITRLQNIKE